VPSLWWAYLLPCGCVSRSVLSVVVNSIPPCYLIKYSVLFMTVDHTYFYIVVDTQRGCHTVKSTFFLQKWGRIVTKGLRNFFFLFHEVFSVLIGLISQKLIKLSKVRTPQRLFFLSSTPNPPTRKCFAKPRVNRRRQIRRCSIL
jgi:hypothetical protein